MSSYQLDSIHISQNLLCYEFLGYMKSVMFYWDLIGAESTLCLHFLSCQQDEACKARG